MQRSSPRRHSRPYRTVAQPAPATTSGSHQVGTPAAALPQVADVRLANGIRLRYLALGDPAGRPVIMLHGLADSSFSFSRILPGLSRVHRVYALDLRGHGDSDRPAEGYAPRDMAADVLGFMDALGIGRATLVGHSMGTFVAQRTAIAAPHRVAGLVLIGSATTALNEVLQEVQRALDELPEAVPEGFAKEFQYSTTHRRLPDDFMARVVAESLKAPARVWRAALGGLLAEERFAGSNETRMPVLLLWGDRDGIFTLAEQERLIEVLPVASLKVYRDTGHAPHWERPREVARDLERFLRTTLA
jgi:pimeloyl-ACP methyl ester carboxylesterase